MFQTNARATTYASNGSATDVQTQIGKCVNGDTVTIPAGTFNWGSTADAVTIFGVGITLQGAGSGSTTITVSVPEDNKLGVLDIEQTATASTRVTGITFTGNGAVAVDGTPTSAPFRLDHNTFTVPGTTSFGVTLLQISGDAPGLVDDNSFSAPQNAEIIHNLGMGPSDASGWADVVTPGNPNMVYVETNTFTNNDPALQTATPSNPGYFYGNSSIQSYYGARNVIRYNKMSMSQVDQHGGTGTTIGARWWEVYENTFAVLPNGSQSNYMALRDGSGVVFNNHTSGAANNQAVGLIEMMDDNTSGSYPTYTQLGRGQNQDSDPAYVWGNETDATMNVVSNGSYVQVNRDYYLSARPNYTPFTYPYPLTAAGMPNPGNTNQPPSITTQPANQTVALGQTATFTVVAAGNPTPTYQWKKNGVAISGATSASYTTPATTLGDNGSYFTVTVTNSQGGVTSNNADLLVTSTLPSPWLQQNVGAVGVAGNATDNAGTFLNVGSGVGIWGTADTFHYTYQVVNSNTCTITARVVSVQNTNGSAAAGVMIRNSPAAGDVNVDLYLTPAGQMFMNQRTALNGSSSHVVSSTAPRPYWVRLVRNGTTFTGYSSPDGTTWTQVGTTTLTMAQQVYVGLPTCANSSGNTALCLGTFDSVTAQ